MKLTVRHTTRYSFATPVNRVIQSHRLTPAGSDGQTVLTWDIDVGPATRGAAFRDGAGDWTETVSLAGPISEFEVTITGEVETADLSGVLRGHRETVPPSAYLTPSRVTAPDAAIRKLAHETVDALGDGASLLDKAHALASAVADRIAYTPGATESATTAAEALEGGEGVCQDHAHVLISAARVAGLPARYVAGYLHSDASGASHQASHGWTEIHVRDLGWIGFDAANRCCPDARYIRLCSGSDATDAAPIRGLVQGEAEEEMEVDVAIADAGQSQSQSQDGQSQSQRQQ